MTKGSPLGGRWKGRSAACLFIVSRTMQSVEAALNSDRRTVCVASDSTPPERLDGRNEWTERRERCETAVHVHRSRRSEFVSLKSSGFLDLVYFSITRVSPAVVVTVTFDGAGMFYGSIYRARGEGDSALDMGGFSKVALRVSFLNRCT